MPIINFSNPFSIFVGVILFVLVLYLAKTNKKAWITGTMLFAFIGLLICHTIEFVSIGSQSDEIYKADNYISRSGLNIYILIIYIIFMGRWYGSKRRKKKKYW